MPRKSSPLRFLFVRVHPDGTAVATGDELPTQTLGATDDLYGTPVSDLEDGVYQLRPRRLKLTIRLHDLQALTASKSAAELSSPQGPGRQKPAASFNWPEICAAVARDMGVPTRQVTRMTLRQVVPKLEDLLYRRGRPDIKRPQAQRLPRKAISRIEDDLAARLAETRQRCNHTLDVVAAKVGVDTGDVFRWTKRTQPVASEHQDKLRAYLDNPDKEDYQRPAGI